MFREVHVRCGWRIRASETSWEKTRKVHLGHIRSENQTCNLRSDIYAVLHRRVASSYLGGNTWISGLTTSTLLSFRNCFNVFYELLCKILFKERLYGSGLADCHRKPWEAAEGSPAAEQHSLISVSGIIHGNYSCQIRPHHNSLVTSSVGH